MDFGLLTTLRTSPVWQWERVLTRFAPTSITSMSTFSKILQATLRPIGLSGVSTTTTHSIKTNGTSMVCATSNFLRKSMEKNTEKMSCSTITSKVPLPSPNNITRSLSSDLNPRKIWPISWKSPTLIPFTLHAKLDTFSRFVSATTLLSPDHSNQLLATKRILTLKPEAVHSHWVWNKKMSKKNTDCWINKL